ncbi:MAG: hypothetical protein ACK5XD_00110, partial [Acidobacteriota bacterium]
RYSSTVPLEGALTATTLRASILPVRLRSPESSTGGGGGAPAVALGAGWLSPVAILVVAVGVGLALDRMGVA